MPTVVVGVIGKIAGAGVHLPAYSIAIDVVVGVQGATVINCTDLQAQ